MRESTIDAGGLRLHLRRRGSGTPLLVLHGLTDSGACWDRAVDGLAAAFDVVAPDARGHGASSRIEHPFSTDDLADDAAAVIRASFPGPAAVWGHSMGAATAAALAARHPDLVSAVVLEDPPFRPPAPEEDGRARADGFRRMLDAVRSAAPEDRLAVAATMNPAWDAAELPGWVAAKLGFDDAVLDRRVPDGDWRTTVRAIDAPLLLLMGDPGRGAIVTSDTAAEVAALRPGVTVRRFPGAGHNVRREASDAVLAAVVPFLRSAAA